MARRSFAEVLTGLIVLTVAVAFLVYAIANSARLVSEEVILCMRASTVSPG